MWCELGVNAYGTVVISFVRYVTKLTITQGLTPNTVYSELQMVYKDYRELVRRLGNRPKLHVVRRAFD